VRLFPAGEIKEEARTFGKTTLSCILRDGMTQVCSEPDTGAVRAVLGQDKEVMRNRVAKFQGTAVALDETILYEGRPAIEGHVDDLRTFDPATVSEKFTDVVKADPGKKAHIARVVSGVMGGRLVTKVQPEYPAEARMHHTQGTVMLSAIIQKDGSVGRLEVLASPEISLSGAALNAVKSWKYKPYVLNGEPVEVETTILVNFTLSGPGPGAF
jgi:TonB family protein